MRRVAVLGTGHSNYMFKSEKPSTELMSETAMEAIIDSGLIPLDIQAFLMGNAWGAFEEGQSTLQSYVANEIGCYNVPATRLEGACSSGTMAVREGFIWVASGFTILFWSEG